MHTVLPVACVALIAASALVPTATAQRTQTLLIRDGSVYINGRLADADDLPDGLETEGVEARFSFTGDATPIFSIGSGLYKLVDGDLLPVEADAGEPDAADSDATDDVSVYFRDRAGAGVAAGRHDPLATAPGVRSDEAADGVYSVRLQQRLGELQQQASELQRRSRQAPDPVIAQQFDRLLEQFEQVVQSSQALPEAQAQRYLSDVQQQDQELYQRLVREWQMERQTYRLADSIQRLPDGPQRDAQVGMLRDLLGQIFDLKQQNREEEIETLKARLAEAQDRLDQREQMRGQIIDHRLRELLGDQQPRP